MSKQIKTKYRRDLLQENAASPCEFWKTMKTLFPTKPKKSQAVHYKGVLSETHPVFTGVPQGSILGHILFIMYMPLQFSKIITTMPMTL